jgi:hypothetical protein
MIAIPRGNWTQATLTLKGARFAPKVYVNGQLVSEQPGGMAATTHRFALPAGAVGGSITLEIALQSLKTLDPKDASAVPGADLWRSNVSSYLWDSVVLRLHGLGEIERVTPFSNLKDDAVMLKWELHQVPQPGSKLKFQVLDGSGKVIFKSGPLDINGPQGTTVISCHGKIHPWSPEQPNLYRLQTEIWSGEQLCDAKEQSFAQRDFSIAGLGFQLNGTPYKIRMGTVVWHRWTRDPEAKDIAFDPVWFENNVVLRLKGLGANALRFHLGLPPDSFLDLCDRDGLAVQMEWPFFHGISASKESMEEQWRVWLDTAMRHPSVAIVHPWNETGGDQLKLARSALDPLLAQYPPFVVSHENLTPIHKYWWSLFENLGLYYDSAEQFHGPVMADEFGGDYLDGNGDPGFYTTTKETFLRFLGRHHTREERLQLQADANARVAEYWRRMGIAGFSPFCIFGSPQDGSNWFLGPMNTAHPKLKPVWSALSAAFAQKSLSLEIWNRNFAPSEIVRTPLWFFNESDRPQTLTATIHIVDINSSKDAMPPVSFQQRVSPHASTHSLVAIPMPNKIGEWRIEARLETSKASSNPVVSAWRIRTFVPHPAKALLTQTLGVSHAETELRQMLTEMNLRVADPSDPNVNIIVGSRDTWQRLHESAQLRDEYQSALKQGKSIVLLDAGPEPLGVGYDAKALGGPLEGAPTVSNPVELEHTSLFGGVDVSFKEAPEPESTLQLPANNGELWDGIPKEATWLWNGLRGGLIVPAADMQVSGLSGNAMLAEWQARGADPKRIPGGSYFAYELAGYYAFADGPNDRVVTEALRQRVKFLVEDAPALESVVNPNAPINVTDLSALYSDSKDKGTAESLTALANAGKNLTRTPVVRLGFGKKTGTLTISQVLTEGRLLPGASRTGPGVYSLRYDPIAVQFVLNMLEGSLTKTRSTAPIP